MTKNETLARVRGQRVEELEQLVMSLNGAQRSLENRLAQTSKDLAEALNVLEEVVAQNKLLQAENQTVNVLKAELQRERDITRVAAQVPFQTRTLLTDYLQPRFSAKDRVQHTRAAQTDLPLTLCKYTQYDSDLVKTRE